MTLSRIQRSIIVVAVLLIASAGIYPPWRGTEKTGKYSPVAEYGWIFSPPVLPWFLAQYDTLQNLTDPALKPYLDPADWAWEIQGPRLGVEWATITLVAFGTVIVLGRRNDKAIAS